MSDFWCRLLFLLRRHQFDRDLDEEMRMHLEMKAEKQGTYAARRQFGSLMLWKDVSREMWGRGSFERFAQDLRRVAPVSPSPCLPVPN